MVTRTGDTALLFPGQGSHVEGMREEVARVRPALLELAIVEVGEDPFPRVEDSTRFAQPAIFCASLALLPAVDLEPVGWMAGHSLGEFAALVAAGSLSAEDALGLVALRGELMDHATGGAGGVLALEGPGAWGMATENAFATRTYPADHNSPGQGVGADA